jgi:hypothetical protein
MNCKRSHGLTLIADYYYYYHHHHHQVVPRQELCLFWRMKAKKFSRKPNAVMKFCFKIANISGDQIILTICTLHHILFRRPYQDGWGTWNAWEINNAYKMLMEKYEGKIRFGRHMHNWGYFYETTQHNIPEDCCLNIRCCEKLTSHLV